MFLNNNKKEIMIFIVIVIFLASVLSISIPLQKVLVTGAAGKTGVIVFTKLLKNDEYVPVAIVRTEASKKKLIKQTKCKDYEVFVTDITDVNELKKVFSGAAKLVICSSATPQIQLQSLIKVLLLKLIRKQGKPTFKFRANGSPYFIDWLGARNYIEAAKSTGTINQVVVVSSMGATQPDNFLNTIGKVEGDDLSGNILLWKRKAEQYLISSGLKYTIIHPGGLIDSKGGERDIIFGVDDQLLQEKSRQIPREDVAEVVVQSLSQAGAINRSFDIISRPREEKSGSEEEKKFLKMDWGSFFSQRGNCKYE